MPDGTEEAIFFAVFCLLYFYKAGLKVGFENLRFKQPIYCAIVSGVSEE